MSEEVEARNKEIVQATMSDCLSLRLAMRFAGRETQ